MLSYNLWLHRAEYNTGTEHDSAGSFVTEPTRISGVHVQCTVYAYAHHIASQTKATDTTTCPPSSDESRKNTCTWRTGYISSLNSYSPFRHFEYKHVYSAQIFHSISPFQFCLKSPRLLFDTIHTHSMHTHIQQYRQRKSFQTNSFL